MGSNVLVVLLEGHSDRLTFEEAFRLLLSEEKPEDSLEVFVFRGDITINDEEGQPIPSEEVVENVCCFISKELRTLGLNPSDLLGVVHLGDLDAAYCDDSCVVYSAKAYKPIYDESQSKVFTKNVYRTIEKNHRKRDALNTLMSLSGLEFGKSRTNPNFRIVPYRYFYFGINLEHAFYQMANCTVSEKERFGLDFKDLHAADLNEWIRFVESLPFEGETYEESCKAARNAKKAFTPLTNLRFAIDFVRKYNFAQRW